MIKKERDAIYKWAAGLSDKQLEKEYYDGVYDCLGSEAEIMYERGYEICDIKEREKIERYMQEKSHIIEQLCEERGIKLWEGWNE